MGRVETCKKRLYMQQEKVEGAPSTLPPVPSDRDSLTLQPATGWVRRARCW